MFSTRTATAFLALTLFLVSASVGLAETRIPVWIQVGSETVPPSQVIHSLGLSTHTLEATARRSGMELLGVSAPGIGGGAHVRTRDGEEFRILLALVIGDFQGSSDARTSGDVLAYAVDGAGERLKGDAQDAASDVCLALANAWIPELEAALARYVEEPFKQEHQMLQESEAEAYDQLRFAQDELAHFQQRLQEAESQVSLPPAVLEKQLSDAVNQQLALELESVGLQARITALEDQIARLVAKAGQGAAEDKELVANLHRAVDALQKELDFVQKQVAVGQATQRDAYRIEGELANAMAELSKARRATSAAQTSTVLDQLQTDLIQSSVRLDECKAKRGFLRDQLDQYAKLRTIETEQVQPLRNQLPALQRQVEALETEYQAARALVHEAERNRQRVIVRKLFPDPAPTDAAAPGNVGPAQPAEAQEPSNASAPSEK